LNWKPFAKSVAYWVMPPGVQEIMRYCLSQGRAKSITGLYGRTLVARNRRFLNTHTGERCFVLATGPSIREEDLTPLRNECCIAVSEFYRHQHYGLIRPAYYAFAPNHPPFTDDDMLRELAEIKECSNEEMFFFAASDRAVVERSNLVTDWNRVQYLDFRRIDYRGKIDLAAPLPRPCSAAVIAVWIAIYMGFSEIYLLGCDHDLLWKWDGATPFITEKYYRHFYDGDPACGNNSADVDSLLQNALQVRETYRWSNRLALERGTRIYNANLRSYLDVVPRVSLGELFQRSNGRINVAGRSANILGE
jgi:hypothetical protein